MLSCFDNIYNLEHSQSHDDACDDDNDDDIGDGDDIVGDDDAERHEEPGEGMYVPLCFC